jgi:hypothetical protein
MPASLAHILQAQYELLRAAALGEETAAEARSGLTVLLRQGMWSWTRVITRGQTPQGAQWSATSGIEGDNIGTRTAYNSKPLECRPSCQGRTRRTGVILANRSCAGPKWSGHQRSRHGSAGAARACVRDVPCAATIWMVDVLAHPGMLPSRGPVASPECSRSTRATPVTAIWAAVVLRHI